MWQNHFKTLETEWVQMEEGETVSEMDVFDNRGDRCIINILWANITFFIYLRSSPFSETSVQVLRGNGRERSWVEKGTILTFEAIWKKQLWKSKQKKKKSHKGWKIARQALCLSTKRFLLTFKNQSCPWLENILQSTERCTADSISAGLKWRSHIRSSRFNLNCKSSEQPFKTVKFSILISSTFWMISWPSWKQIW